MTAKKTILKLGKKKPTSAREKSLAPEDPDDAYVKKEGAGVVEVAGDEGEPLQAPLISEADMPPVVEADPIQNGRVAATYVGMSLDRGKKGEKMVLLEFSFVLTAAHAFHVPKRLSDAYAWLVGEDNKSIQVSHIEPQTVDVFDTPRAKKTQLHMVDAVVSRAVVSMVEESGKGKTRKVIRCSVRFSVERDVDVIAYSAWRDQETFWLQLGDTQGSLA
jgi:hypothetical protein